MLLGANAARCSFEPGVLHSRSSCAAVRCDACSIRQYAVVGHREGSMPYYDVAWGSIPSSSAAIRGCTPCCATVCLSTPSSTAGHRATLQQGEECFPP
eukprot:10857550-Alexandrium_andersonii.AAC.1